MNRKEIICRGDELFRLIPQRPPMVMIDRFYGIEENTSWSGLTVTPDNLFCRDGVLQETGIIYKPQNKMFRFYKTFCSRITLINTNQNVILNPI